MIQRVYEQAVKAKKLDQVIVATDHEKIFNTVKRFGGNVEMTSESAVNGTERIAEVAAKFDCSLVVNIQGDEPLIDPNVIDQLVGLMEKNPEVPVGTLVNRIENVEDLRNPNIVKVVIDKQWNALYFSRSVIPYYRNDSDKAQWLIKCDYYQHVGIYIYRRDFLLKLVNLSQTSLEKAEQLEQLRILENGYKIKVGLTDKRSIGVDVPDDVQRIEKFLMENSIE